MYSCVPVGEATGSEIVASFSVPGGDQLKVMPLSSSTAMATSSSTQLSCPAPLLISCRQRNRVVGVCAGPGMGSTTEPKDGNCVSVYVAISTQLLPLIEYSTRMFSPASTSSQGAVPLQIFKAKRKAPPALTSNGSVRAKRRPSPSN